MSEYIKKEDALQALHDFWDEYIGYDGSGAEMMLDNESVINSLPTYSFPDSANIEKIRAEIKNCIGKWDDTSSDTCFNMALEIIDKYIGGKSNEEE